MLSVACTFALPHITQDLFVEDILMYRMISSCPVCGGDLYIPALQCSECGLEIRKDFEITGFERLSEEQMTFLLAFLKSQGNLAAVQADLGIAYPAAKEKLHDLLAAMELTDNTACDPADSNDSDLWARASQDDCASGIVRAKLAECGGSAIIRTYKGKEYTLRAVDEEGFSCDEILDYKYSVFDVIVEALVSQGGKAKKGYGRRRLGEFGCEETTVAGAVMKNYFGKQNGESCFDPTFALVAILEWAGVVKNGWGYVELSEQYREWILPT